MTLRSGDIEAALIDDVCSRVRARLGDDEALKVEEFVRQYYRLVPPEDLIGRSELDVYGAALAHWNFLCRRAPGEAKVRVYNPQFEQHGWQSTHTVVEIVTEDMPFLVDSVSMELGRNGYGIHLVINPVVRVRRDDDGQVVAVLPLGEADDAATAESVMHVEVDRQPEGSELEALRSDLLRVLGAVRASVEDWPQMRARVRELIAELDTSRPPVESSEIEEAKALLEWLDEGHFTFLGFREYELLTQRGEDQLRAIEGSGLGILRQASGKRVSRGFERLPACASSLAPPACST
jgi:glutamate dehydrogenase